MIVPDAVICDPAIGLLIVLGGATNTPVGLTIEPSRCTIEPAGIYDSRLVEILPSVVVVPAASAVITVPDAVIWDPTTGSGTVPGGATTTPVGLTIEPSPRTDEPGGTDVSKSCEMAPSVSVVPATDPEIIFPEAVIWEPPGTVSGTVPLGATNTPVGLTIEPSSCTTDPGGTYLSKLVEIAPSVVVVPAANAEMIVPEAVTCDPTSFLSTVLAGATITPVGLIIEPSCNTIEPAGTEVNILVEIFPSVVVVPAADPDIMFPDAVIWDPGTGSGTVPAGATITPVGLIIEPSSWTDDPGGIDLNRLVDMAPSVVVVPAASAEIIVPEAVT
jgi:hypothetical protein